MRRKTRKKIKDENEDSEYNQNVGTTIALTSPENYVAYAPRVLNVELHMQMQLTTKLRKKTRRKRISGQTTAAAEPHLGFITRTGEDLRDGISEL
ncbi:hypothetical protein Tco_0345821 [Tanacetum coccineum]